MALDAKNTQGDFKDIRADAATSAKTKAKAKLRKQNKNEWQCVLTLLGNLSIADGITFNIEGYGVYDGKYIADTVTHTLAGSGGFETQVEAHRVLKGY